MSTHTLKFSMAALTFALVGATPPSFATSVAAPDATPLLFDRIRKFENVIVAHLDDGFEKQIIRELNSNCVRLAVKVEKTLKGELKPGAVISISCHQELPARLAARDAGKRPRYLLVLSFANEGYAYLGGGLLETDLDRFLLSDDSLEAVANSFITADDDTPDNLLEDCLLLLAKVDLTQASWRHVHELLDRLAPLCGEDDKARAADQLGALLEKADHPGAEAVYNMVVDALTIIGKGEDLTRKTIESQHAK